MELMKRLDSEFVITEGFTAHVTLVQVNEIRDHCLNRKPTNQ